MSYNGTGTFNINTAGQPVVTGTTITSTAFNLLTADLAVGLTTALTKDGQTTPTANIPMGTFKITGLGAGTALTDAAQFGQLQAGATQIATVTGTDTIAGTLTPTPTAYATGNLFSFVAANTNTGAATINLNSLGAKSITKLGSTALVAGDIVSGRVYLIEYDGTRFQLINPTPTSGTVTSVGGTGTVNGLTLTGTVTSSGNLTLGGTLDLSSPPAIGGTAAAAGSFTTLSATGVTTVQAGTAALPAIVSTTGTADTGLWFPAADTVAASTGGTERMRIDSSGNLGLGVTPSALSLSGFIEGGYGTFGQTSSLGTSIGGNAYYNSGWKYKVSSTATLQLQDSGGFKWHNAASGTAGNAITFTQAMTLETSGSLLVGCTVSNPSTSGFAVVKASATFTQTDHASGSASGEQYARFSYAGTNIGSITQSGTTAVLYNTTSDQRLKDNIQDADSASSLIDSLQVRKFDWKSDASHQRYGFIAQELVTVAPEAVHQPTDPDDMMAVDYSKLVPMLVKEIQSLRKRLTALEQA